MHEVERLSEEDPRRNAALPEVEKASGNRRRWFVLLAPPTLFLLAILVLWNVVTVVFAVPDYILPSPIDIIGAGIENRVELLSAIFTTIIPITIGYAAAIIVGMGMALVMSLSKIIERSVYPYAVVLQTIPIVAIAPVIVIWFGAGVTSVSIITFVIALFPMVSNTILGLNSTDHNLINLMRLYNASPAQTMLKLRIPFALPYIMGGLKISAGLAVIGAIVGQFVAGIGGGEGGLGYLVTAAAINLQTAYLFAAALTAGLLGVVIFVLVSLLSGLVLGSWHESSAKQEN